MNSRRSPLFALSLLGAVLTPVASRADSVLLTRDSVIPVVFDTALTLNDSRVGDHFTAHVDADRDLPSGTRLEGRIVAIRFPRPNGPASMDLEFTAIVLPSGYGTRINAIPIPLNKDLIRTDSDGRLFVKSDVRRQGEYVMGGALGGYLIGSLFHRRITGLFLGTIVGAIAANSDRDHSENTIVDKGAKLGALFNQEVSIDLNGAPQGNRGWDSGTRADTVSGGRGWDGYTHGGGAVAAPSQPPAPTGGNRGWDSGNAKPDQSSTPAGPPADISVRLGDHTLTFESGAAPYYQGETIMVPVSKMADFLGLSFEKADQNSAYVEDANNSLKLEQDSVNYRFNGKRGTLSHPVVIKKDVMYAPVEIFAALSPKDLVVNGRKLAKEDLDGGGD